MFVLCSFHVLWETVLRYTSLVQAYTNFSIHAQKSIDRQICFISLFSKLPEVL